MDLTTPPKQLKGPNLYARVIRIIDGLIRHSIGSPKGVRELADKLELSRSTVGRLLIELTQQELASEFPGGKYGVGPRLQVLSDRLHRGEPVFNACRRIISEIFPASGVSVCLALDEPIVDGFFYAIANEAAPGLTFRPPIGQVLAGRASQALSGANGGQYRCVTALEFSIEKRLKGTLVLMSTDVIPDDVISLVRDRLTELEYYTPERLPLPGNTKDPLPGRGSATGRLHRLLSALAISGGATNDDSALVEYLDAKRQTVDQVLSAATEAGLAVRSGTQIASGPLLLRWVARLGEVTAFDQLIRPRLQVLSGRTGETIGLALYDRTQEKLYFADAVHGWQSLQYHLELGTELPLYAGAAGKAVLAHCGDRVINAQKLIPYTSNTITDMDALRRDLNEVKRRGWATGDGERVMGAFGVAVPFFRDGAVAGSLTATIPNARKDQVDVRQLAQEIQQTAASITSLVSLA